MTKLSISIFLATLTLSSCGPTSSIPSDKNFFTLTDYSKTDPYSQENNVIIFVHSKSCSHCLTAEPYLYDLYQEEEFKQYRFVSVLSSQIFDYYSINMDFEEFIDKYYEQTEEYIIKSLTKDDLLSNNSIPTPTAIYLDENREFVHSLMGLGNSIQSIKERLNLLLKK